MQLPIIGFAGYGRCGKDTSLSLLNEALRENNMVQHIRVALADPGKKDMEKILKRIKSIPAFSNMSPEDQKQLLRPLYETYMTDVIRDLDPDHWIRTADTEMKYAEANCGEHRPLLWAISDVRYLNEARYILGKGGSLFVVTRDSEGPKGDREKQGLDEIFRALGTGRIPHDRVHIVRNNQDVQHLKKLLFDLYLQDCVAELSLPEAARQAQKMLRRKNGKQD